MPHNETGGWEAMMSPILAMEGREKVGFGFGDRVFAPLRSAIKAAFLFF